MNSTTEFRHVTPEDPQAIEAQNEQIRADMGETLQALERKLSPGQLLDRALGLAKEHGGEIAGNIGRSIKENPFPVLLTIAGIAWLMSSQRRSTASVEDSEVSAAGDSAGEMSEATSHVSETLHSAREHISSSAASMRQTAQNAAERTREMLGSARYRAQRARESFDTMLEEHPLALGAIGVGLGAVIAAALPETERENRLMGEARQRTLARARQEGRRQYQKVRETASRAAQAAKESAVETLQDDRRPH